MKQYRFTSNPLLYIAPAIYTIIYLGYYPPIYATSDESTILGMAYVLRNLTIFPQSVNQYLLHTVLVNGRLVSVYPLGMSLLLVPFTYLGEAALFLLPLLMHLVGYLVFIKILDYLNFDRRCAIMLLFYPGFVLYTRTLCNNSTVAVFFLFALYLYLRTGLGSSLMCGIVSGIMLWFRIDSIILAGLLLFSMLFITGNGVLRQRIRGSLYFILSIMPFIIALLIYQKIAFGHYLLSGYQLTKQSIPLFSYQYMFRNIPLYLAVLNAIYPLMLASLLFYGGRLHLEIKLVGLILIFFYGTYFWFDFGNNIVETAVRGTRFVLPLVPLLLIPYFSAINRLMRSKQGGRTVGVVWISILLVLGGGDIMISNSHQHFLLRQRQFSQALYKNTTEGALIISEGVVIELMQRMWGDREVIDISENDFDPEQIKRTTSKDIFVVALSKKENPGAGLSTRRFLENIAETYKIQETRRICQNSWTMQFFRLYPKSFSTL